MMYIILVSFYYVATVLQSIMYIKKIPSILGYVKKNVEHCLKEEATLLHQSFRELQQSSDSYC